MNLMLFLFGAVVVVAAIGIVGSIIFKAVQGTVARLPTPIELEAYDAQVRASAPFAGTSQRHTPPKRALDVTPATDPPDGGGESQSQGDDAAYEAAMLISHGNYKEAAKKGYI